MGVVLKGSFVFFVPGSEVSSSLPCVRLTAVGTGEFVHTGACELVVMVFVVGEEVT